MMYIISSGEIKSGIILENNTMTVLDGGTVTSTTLNYYGSMYISSGGTANTTTVNAGGSLYISSGGTATNIVWTPCEGHVYVSEGGYATFASQYSGVYFGSSGHLLSSADVMDGMTFDHPYEMNVMNGGTVTSTTLNYYGFMYVSGGGTATSTTLNGGCLWVSSGGTANSTTVNSQGFLVVSNGGKANETSLVDFCRLSLYGGEANNTLVCSGGSMFVSCGGTANNTILNDRGYLYVSSNGIACDTTINNSCSCYVTNGGNVSRVTVNAGGIFRIYDSAVASVVTVNQNGRMYIASGGTAHFIKENGGFVSVSENTDVSFESNAFSDFVLKSVATLHSGTTATNTRISAGNLAVFSSGIANDTTIYGNGSMTIMSGGIVSSVKTYAGGQLNVSQGGILTGKMSFLAGAVFQVEEGAILNFDLTKFAAGGNAIMNDWSLIQGTPVYTITVSDTQATGIYKLADAADEFDGTITVQNVLGESLGTLALGQTVTIGETDYTLSVTDGSLSVTLGTIAPPVPAAPTGLMSFVVDRNVALVWDVSTDESGVKEYVVTYSLDGQEFTVRTSGTSYVLKNADFGTWSWSVQAIDAAGNESEIAAGEAFTVSSFEPYIVEYSTDSFEHVLRLKVSTQALDSFRLPTGTYEWRIRSESVSDWQTGDPIVSVADSTPTFVKSDADGNDDLFFANPCGTWETGYFAQHVGSVDEDWGGTQEYAAVAGKNKLADFFVGSDDLSILFLTDDVNGDALFVDDIYTELPGTLEEQQARIAQISEIRGGAGDDIIDMTSQRFEYIGGGISLRGGDGNDVLWANKGDNWLFGDLGNDRIVGASGDDLIVGGAGDDRMHGGGGDDVFTFCENWGKDTIEQLAGGKVTLWFASGDVSNWDEAELTYTDGDNKVTVKGVTADRIELKFGDDGTEMFAWLAGLDAFEAYSSRKIFEEAPSTIAEA